jgi:hypothetical protein
VSRDRERYPSKGTRSCPLSPASDGLEAHRTKCSSALWAPSHPQCGVFVTTTSRLVEKGAFGVALIATTLVVTSVSSVQAQQEPPAEESAPPVAPKLDPAKKALLSDGFFLIAVVILFGLGLVLLTMLWGWRTRRFLRKKIPAAKPPDELWFLKGKHPPEPPADP